MSVFQEKMYKHQAQAICMERYTYFALSDEEKYADTIRVVRGTMSSCTIVTIAPLKSSINSWLVTNDECGSSQPTGKGEVTHFRT